MKYKVGDRVKITRAEYSFDLEHVGKTGRIVEIAADPSPYVIEGVEQYWREDELELIKEKDMYKQGDVLVKDNMDYQYTVQGMIGEIVFYIDPEDGMADSMTVAELRDSGWHLKTETPTTELTIDQIAEKFGMKPEEVRIKKEGN
jgi:hypothetical protein